MVPQVLEYKGVFDMFSALKELTVMFREGGVREPRPHRHSVCIYPCVLCGLDINRVDLGSGCLCGEECRQLGGARSHKALAVRG